MDDRELMKPLISEFGLTQCILFAKMMSAYYKSAYEAEIDAGTSSFEIEEIMFISAWWNKYSEELLQLSLEKEEI